jgi:hypothetical protein
MDPKSSATRAAVVVAGAMMLFTAISTAEAQRRDPRVATAASQRDHRVPTSDLTRPRTQPPVAGPVGVADTRRRAGQLDHRRLRNQQRNGSTVVYVGDYGYGYGYYPSVYDANGRPLSESYESAPATGGYGYTPDLSGSPYVVSDEGLMVGDFASGERRAFRSCVESADQRDPQGRPRTIFYRPPDAWMIQRPGQRGRVRGEPPAARSACYAVDSVGRMVLRY